MPVGEAQVWVSQESLRGDEVSSARGAVLERRGDRPEAVSADVDGFECHAGGVASEGEADVPRSWLPGEEGKRAQRVVIGRVSSSLAQF